MRLNTCSNYTSHRDWFIDVLQGLDVVLCLTSALECLGLFIGYVNEADIDVYSKSLLPFDNLNCLVVENFDGLDIVESWGLRCTSINQTVNDLLRNFDNIDEQSLAQGLSDYYYANGQSFDKLEIAPENAETFEKIKDWAIEFYNYG
jgi:hypothetical protein